MNKQINIVYDFLDEVGGLENVIVFQANTIKQNTDLKPKIFFSHIAKGKEKLLNEQLGLINGIPILKPINGWNKIGNFINHMLFPDRFYKLPGPAISHSFLSSRMLMKRKERGEAPFIFFAQHPPNFLYDRSWTWVNNFPRFVAYIAGLFLGPLLRKWDKEATLSADKIFVNSEHTKKRIEKIYGHKNVEVMFPPIKEEFKVYTGNLKKAYKMVLENKRIKKDFIHMHGRMILDKKPELGIQAFSLIQNKDIDLVISGTIEDKEKLESLIKEKGLKNKVHLLGKVSKEELLALYNYAKCFIMQPPKEDFGLVSVESMACGTPVVAWKECGPKEQVIPGINGELAKPYDVNDMAMKIDKVLETKYNRNKVSKSVNKFKAKAIKKQFLDAVKELCLEYEYKYH